MKKILCLSILSLFVLFFDNLSAQQQDTIYASYRYVMGDNDTKTEAKQICFLEAKRLCLEQAGTYLESQVKVENYQLAKDEISTYSASFLQVEIISEEIEMVGESLAIHTTVRAIIDPLELREQLNQFKEDQEIQQQMVKETKDQQKVENEVLRLRDELQKSTPEQRENLRSQLKDALQRMQKLEDKKQKIITATHSAIKNIRVGMSSEQVLKLAGEPLDKAKYKGDLRLNYGMIWVVFKHDRVTCLVKGLYFRPEKQCRDYTNGQRFRR